MKKLAAIITAFTLALLPSTPAFAVEDGLGNEFFPLNGGSGNFYIYDDDLTFNPSTETGTGVIFSVDEANQRVGIGTATPTVDLDVSAAENTEFIRLSDETNSDSSGIFIGDGSPAAISAQLGSIYLDNDATNDTTGTMYIKTGNDGAAGGWSEVTTGGMNDLQGAYDDGAAGEITTTDARDIDFILADTATDSNFDIDIAADNTVSVSRLANALAETPAQLLLLENLDDDITIADAFLVQSTGASDITDAIDASDADIDNALNAGPNTILGTTAVIDFEDFDVSADGIMDFNSDTAGDQITVNSPAGDHQSLVVDATSNANTSTLGIVDLNIGAGNAAVDGINVGLTVNDGATAATDFEGVVVGLTANDADADVFGLSITSAETANAAAGSYEALIRLENAESTAGAVPDGILVTSSGTDGDIVDAIDASAGNIDNALNAGANTIVGTTAVIDFTSFDVASTGQTTVARASNSDFFELSDTTSGFAPTLMTGTSDPSAGGGVAADEGSLYMDNTDTAGALWLKTGDADTAWSQVTTGGMNDLQGAYDDGAAGEITTTDARDIDFILADTATDSNFDIDIAADNTVSVSRLANALAETPAQLLLLENLDDDITIADAFLVQSTGASDITDAIDASDADIDNALNAGPNTILGTTAVIDFEDFDVSADGIMDFNSDTAGDQITVNSPAGDHQSLVVDATSNANTSTLGIVDLNIGAGNAAVDGINVGLTVNDGATAATDFEGVVVGLTANDADADVFGLSITSAETANAAAGSYEALIRLENAESTAGAVPDGILVTSSGTDGDIVDAIDASAGNIDNALNAGANTIVGTTAVIDFTSFDVASTGQTTVARASNSDFFELSDTTSGFAPTLMTGTSDPSAGGGVAADEGSLYMDNTDTAGALWLKTGDADTAWSQVTTGGMNDLQGAYDDGAAGEITTTDARDIDFILADTATDSNFDIDIAADNTVSVSRLANALAETPAQLLLLENLDDDITIADAFLVQSTGASDITDAIDASDADIDNALNAGPNTILGTTAVIDFEDFDVSADGIMDFNSDTAGDQITVNSPAGDHQSLVVDATSNANTSTLGIVDLNIGAGNAAVDGINVGLTVNDGATAATDFEGVVVGLTANDADADVFGLSITSAETANAAAGSYEALIRLENAESTAGAVPDGILVTSSGTDGDIVDAIDASAGNIDNALNAGANTIVGTTAVIDFTSFDVASTGQTTVARASNSDFFELSDTTSGFAPTLMTGTSDPSAGGGVAADEGSLYMDNTDTAGLLWLKTGDADTAWSQVTTGATGYIQNGNNFGAPAVLGTNDANSLSFETNTVTHMTIADGGATTVNTSGAAVDFTVQTDNDATAFYVDGSADEVVMGRPVVYEDNADQSLNAGDSINSALGSYAVIGGNGGNVDLTSNPQISAGTAGQMLIIEGTSNTVRLDDSDGLQLQRGISFTLGAGDTMSFIYNATNSVWVELSRRNN